MRNGIGQLLSASGKISGSTNRKYIQSIVFGSVVMVIYIVLITETLSIENEKL